MWVILSFVQVDYTGGECVLKIRDIIVTEFANGTSLHHTTISRSLSPKFSFTGLSLSTRSLTGVQYFTWSAVKPIALRRVKINEFVYEPGIDNSTSVPRPAPDLNGSDVGLWINKGFRVRRGVSPVGSDMCGIMARDLIRLWFKTHQASIRNLLAVTEHWFGQSPLSCGNYIRCVPKPPFFTLMLQARQSVSTAHLISNLYIAPARFPIFPRDLQLTPTSPNTAGKLCEI